jgi:hypothetical protein
VVGWSVLRALATVRPPGPFGTEAADHELLHGALQRLVSEGPSVLDQLENDLSTYLTESSTRVPDHMTKDEALAFWINLYNAGALILAGRAQRSGEDTVLGVPGGFQSDFITVDGERLSPDDIEHGKLRRFRDPRIHAALVCGSVSCPTLRGEPYLGAGLNQQLDDQLRYFLAAGGCFVDPAENVVRLSRVFLWFGGDFVRPHRMPTFIPVSRSSVMLALTPWLDPETVDWIALARPAIAFQSYDWGLRCVVR